MDETNREDIRREKREDDIVTVFGAVTILSFWASIVLAALGATKMLNVIIMIYTVSVLGNCFITKGVSIKKKVLYFAILEIIIAIPSILIIFIRGLF